MKMQSGRFVVYDNAIKESHSRQAIKWQAMFVKKFGYDPDEEYTLSLEPNELSPVIRGDQACYLIQLLEKKPIDEEVFEQEAPALKTRVSQEKQMQVYAAWFEDLKQKAKIEDNRHYFYDF